MSELADAIADFDAAEVSHPALMLALEAKLRPSVDTLPAVSLESALRQFDLDEESLRILASDPGWTGDLIIFAAVTLQRIDPALRSAFPAANSFIEGAAASVFPGGGLVAHILLVLAEGPLLSTIEAWLVAKAAKIKAGAR